jgi:hypothetical protein
MAGERKMKSRFLISTLIAALVTIGATLTASADQHQLGPEVPFPLGTEIPFPWDTIQGVWHAKDVNFDTLFSFRVKGDAHGDSYILQVTQIDPESGMILGEGAGFGDNEERIVRAGMTTNDGYKYMVFLRAYNPDKNSNQVATVLTIREIDSCDEFHFILEKLSNEPMAEGQ